MERNAGEWLADTKKTEKEEQTSQRGRNKKN